MLKLFQVNVGRYIYLTDEIPPTSRVRELCEAVEGVSGEGAEGVVMLTSEGQQMEPNELIGRYSVGTERKPIFVFFRSHLQSPSPPLTPSLVTLRPELYQQLQMLSHKPTPAHFQKQISLALQLGDYGVELGRVCEVLCEEVRLQGEGWRTVLHNCKGIIRTYRKHQQFFQLAVENITTARPHYLQLLEDFPAQVEVLQNLPVPTAPTSTVSPTTSSSSSSPNVSSMASSLYDWISTHDEKNSLLDLSSECQRALQQVEADQIQSAVARSEEIISSPELQSLEDEGEEEKDTERLDDLHKRSAELAQIQRSLAQNMQSTSQRALRSGDAGTLADLLPSHQSTLVLMGEQAGQLESCVREAEEAKQRLTQHIHRQLQVVTQLQMRISESNSHLLFLHEHIKLAKKRFEILDQVCSTPLVLVSVLREIDRRRAFNTSLQQRIQSDSTQLKEARMREKEQRKAFSSSHGHHFLLTLFPELQNRVPDFTCHVTRPGDQAPPTPDSELEKLKGLLPQELRPAPLPEDLLSVSVAAHGVSEKAALERRVKDKGVQGVEEELRAKLSRSQKDLESLQQEFETERTRLTKQVQQSQGELSALAQEGEQKLAHVMEQLETCCGERERAKEALVCVEGERERLRGEAGEMRLDRDLKAADIERCLKENTGLQNQLQHLRGQLNDLQCSARENSAQLKLCTAENSSLRDQLQCFREELQPLEDKNASLQERLGHTVSENTALTAEVQSLKKAVERVRAESSQMVERLRHDCTIQREERERVESRHQQAQATLGSLRAQMEQAQVKINTLEQCRSDLSRSSEQCEAFKSRVRELENSLTAVQAKKFQLESKLTEKERSVLDRENLQEVALGESRSELENMTQECTVLEEQVHGLEREREQLESELSRVEGQVVKRDAEKEEIEGKLLQAMRQLASTEEDAKKEAGEKHAALESIQLELREKAERGVSLEGRVKELEVKISLAEDELAATELTCSMRVAALEEQASKADEKAKAAEEMVGGLRKKVSFTENELASRELERDTSMAKVSVLEEQARRADERIKAAEAKVRDLEGEIARREEELVDLRDQLREKLKITEDTSSELPSQVMDLRSEVMELQAEKQKLCMEIVSYRTEIKDLSRQISEERDAHMKEAMELEREMKELRRQTEGSPPFPTSLTLVTSTPAPTPIEMTEKVTLSSFHVGDLALFLADRYKNYLALSVDGRIYYLNHSCVAAFTQDISARILRVDLKRKVLLGRITSRVLVEVRKEGNRLGVPVGERLYKVDAVEVIV